MGCKDIGIRKCEFVTKTQFLCVLMKAIKKSETIEVNKMEKYDSLSRREGKKWTTVKHRRRTTKSDERKKWKI